MGRAAAVEELDEAGVRFEETIKELNAIDVCSLDPAQGLALIPFAKNDELAWYVFDLFAPQGMKAWRFHEDPLESRRPLERNTDSRSPIQRV
jgi:hypothetical protein